MAFSESNGKVILYMEVVQRLLREQAISEMPFHYGRFRQSLDEQNFSREQADPMNLRFDLLESFMVDRKPANTRKRSKAEKHAELFNFKPGTLTIVDLSDPFVDAATACVLFDTCLSLIQEKRPESGLVIALDEAHKYMNESAAATEFTDHLLLTVREQRHNSTRVYIATQEPTVSEKLLDLCSVSIIHRFSFPAWFHTIKNHLGGASEMRTSREMQKEMFERIVHFNVGEAFVFSPSSYVCMDDETEAPKKLGASVLKMQTRIRKGIDGGMSMLTSEALTAEVGKLSVN